MPICLYPQGAIGNWNGKSRQRKRNRREDGGANGGKCGEGRGGKIEKETHGNVEKETPVLPRKIPSDFVDRHGGEWYSMYVATVKMRVKQVKP